MAYDKKGYQITADNDYHSREIDNLNPVIWQPCLSSAVSPKNMERSPAFSIIKQKLEREFRVLEEKQVTPWAFLNASKPFRVEKFDGGFITCQGIKFAGSSRDVFWGSYIRLFLEDIVDRAFSETRAFCIEHDISRRMPLEETSSQLQRGCSRVYNRMADIDQRLRGEGFPDSVSKKDVFHEIDRMRDFVFARLDSENALSPKPEEKTVNSWYEQNKFWVWIIGVSLTVLGLLAKFFL